MSKIKDRAIKITSLNKSLKEAIADGDLSGGGTGTSVQNQIFKMAVNSWVAGTTIASRIGGDVCFGYQNSDTKKPVYVGVFSSTVSGQGAAYSVDGINWTQATTPAVTNKWYGVFYVNGDFIAVGSTSGDLSTTIYMTSPDGVTWTQRAWPANTGFFRGVAYGAGIYVAAFDPNSAPGTTYYTATSSAGSWTSRTMTGSEFRMGVAFGAGLFVMVGSGTSVWTSPDGTTWTSRTVAGLNGFLKDIIYANGMFVAVGQGDIITSSDGLTWTKRTNSTGLNSLLRVDGGLGGFVAIDSTSTSSASVIYSTDGITWTLGKKGTPEGVVTSTTFNLMGIGYGKGVFVIATSVSGVPFVRTLFTGLE